jgi:PAS domain-containing protein
MLERVKASDGVVVFDREEGGDGKLSAAKITASGEVRGVWILGSYTAEESEILKEVGEDQQLLAEVLSDYMTKSVTLELESAKYKGAGVKLREELARQGIINDALRKINSGILDAVDAAVDDTLRDVGLNMNIDNVALYKYGKGHTDEFELRNFWNVKGEEPNDEYVYGFPKRKYRVESRIDENSECYIADSSNMTDGAKTSLMKYNLKAVIIYPIYRNGKIYGMMLFGEAKENRTWTPEEIRFAKSITLIIQNILENAEGDDNVRNVNKHLIETYNNFTVGIFVRDMYSGEVLFSNKVMNEMMGREFAGGNCREIITDLHDRFDNTDGMRKSFITRNRVNTWRSYIKRFDAIMDITEISMEWLNGEPAALIVLREAHD